MCQISNRTTAKIDENQFLQEKRNKNRENFLKTGKIYIMYHDAGKIE